MKILYFTKYSRSGASSRMRSYQYFPYFEKKGWTVIAKPLFNDPYLNNLYNGRKNKLQILYAYLKRFFLLFTIKGYDRVVIEKELFPYLPACAERILKFFGVKYIVDYDDAIFHNYDLSKNKLIRNLLSKKIDKVMKHSNLVVAGNNYLAERAKMAGAKQVEIIPTVVDLNRYSAKTNYSENQNLVIGWIGSPSTYKYVEKIKSVLEVVCNKTKAVVHIVGAFPDKKQDGVFFYFPWNEQTETEMIKRFDVGIMPLDDTPWAKGKCAFKLIQYMASGVPVVASPVGMNNEVAIDNVTGYTALNAKDWISGLEKLLMDSELRKELGVNGRKLVEQKYSLQVTFNKWIKLLDT